MDKRGWGLTLESDPITFFPTTKTPSSSASSFSRLKDMVGEPVRMFPFPVNLVGRDAAPPSPSDDTRVAVDEVDFFSHHRKNDRDNDHDEDDDRKTAAGFGVKKENSHGRSDLHDVNIGLHLLTANASDQSTVDDGVSSEMEDKRAKTELAQLQVELNRMNTENQKLKEMLSQVTNNYSALQMHFVGLMQRQQHNHGAESARNHEIVDAKLEDKKHESVVPRQFMDLGPSAETEEITQSSSDERTHSGSLPKNIEVASNERVKNKGNNEIVPFDHDNSINGKRNGREESPESETQGWNPNKFQKLNSSPKTSVDQSTEATMRKARVSVRARSEAPMISDGCQWRKYGQKMAKGNPCPRAYYRCTMAVGCPVRKQVQRCAEDKTILVTTYEGNHNHPLPPAAMAMASTTTAAATMLLSGSMSSGDGLMNPNLLARAILPCSSSVATISASAPFPTVTLDLTHNPNPLQIQRPPTQFQVPFTAQAPQNFVSVPTNPQLPQIFGQALHNQSKFSGLQLSNGIGSSQLSHHGLVQSALLHQQSQQPSLADSVSAITADPNFTAALAAAISSIIGGAHPAGNHSNTSNANNSNASVTTTNNNNKINSFSRN